LSKIQFSIIFHIYLGFLWDCILQVLWPKSYQHFLFSLGEFHNTIDLQLISDCIRWVPHNHMSVAHTGNMYYSVWAPLKPQSMLVTLLTSNNKDHAQTVFCYVLVTLQHETLKRMDLNLNYSFVTEPYEVLFRC
jgi:hypothetical protein